jgi:hypothetical protein
MTRSPGTSLLGTKCDKSVNPGQINYCRLEGPPNVKPHIYGSNARLGLGAYRGQPASAAQPLCAKHQLEIHNTSRTPRILCKLSCESHHPTQHKLVQSICPKMTGSSYPSSTSPILNEPKSRDPPDDPTSPLITGSAMGSSSRTTKQPDVEEEGFVYKEVNWKHVFLKPKYIRT